MKKILNSDHTTVAGGMLYYAGGKYKELLKQRKDIIDYYKQLKEQLMIVIRNGQHFTKLYKEAQSVTEKNKNDLMRKQCAVRYVNLEDQMKGCIENIKKLDIALSMYNNSDKYKNETLNACYATIVGGLLYFVENYNKPCYQISSDLKQFSFSKSLNNLIIANQKNKEVSEDRINALRDSVKFIEDYVQKGIRSNPKDKNYQELNKDAVFGLLQNVTGESKFTKEYFSKFNIKDFDAEEYSK